MEPFYLKPVFKDYIWGGDKLKRIYNKQTEFSTVAESWELSVYRGSESVIASGVHSGMSLGEFAGKYPELLGGRGDINLLVKLIDAKEALSVQVHPDDAYAARVENGFGKTEAWHVLECEPGAFLYYGFSRDTNREEVEERIRWGTLTEILRKINVKPGDTFFIPAGTIHAIGAGIVIAEIQQSSDATYRVYDFGRRDANGNPRALHIQKALDVMRFEPSLPDQEGRSLEKKSGYGLTELASCQYFKAEKLSLHGAWECRAGADRYRALLCTHGSGTLECGGKLVVKKGDSIFIPAGNMGFSISGSGEFLIISQN